MSATKVPGVLFPVSTDRARLLSDAYETNLIAASRRYMSDASRKGYTITDAEARGWVIDRYDSGDHAILPQYHAIKNR